ncbi:MAG: polysaccharide ABC transporter ATP-binding protein [Rikenellaceae bacterium]
MTAIEFNNISKQYRLGLVSSRTISHDLNRWWQTSVLGNEDPFLKIGEVNDRSTRGESDYIWALRNIDFKVEQGDILGIIGKNGSGKSTLLKILSRITTPTTGSIKIQGRVASLLEVGTGFHGEMTGRENIYMNGAIIGMTKREITNKINEIIEFSGVERYIDTPVKRYSSGMTVRLGFAIAAFLEQEILVVDEVLAVGDAEFQKRAIGKMQEVSSHQGRTVLFVSHNMSSMRQLCTSGLLLDNGEISYRGSISDTISEYFSSNDKANSFEGDEKSYRDIMYLEHAKVYPSSGGLIHNGSEIIVEMNVLVRQTITAPVIGFNIFSSYGHPLARADFNDRIGYHALKPGRYTFRFRIPAYRFSVGEYRIALAVGIRLTKNYASPKSNLYFSVMPDPNGFGSVVHQDTIVKSSIIREDWFEEFISH